MKRTQKGKEKGQSLIEFALMLPILLFILAGVVDLGRLYYVIVAVTDAAAEGAAYAAINPTDTTEIINRTQAASDGLVEIEADMVTVECPAVSAGSPITVSVEYEFTVATPLINAIVPGGVLPLNTVATEVILSGGM